MISNQVKKTGVAAVIVLVMGTALMAAPLFGAAEAKKPQTEKVPFPRPGSHKGNWIDYHGSLAAAEGASPTKPPKACVICHERNDCIACHETRPPRDHTNYWRTRSHGFYAEGNRARCLICHRQDYCIRCHSETAPRTHTASWRSRHCTWCHYGSGSAPADNCVVCHKAALHTSAPHTVNGSINCSLCHH